MSNYIEYNDTVAFHPGYYIKEIIDESGLTQEDFAKRLDTTPKNLSLLVRGEQSLSTDIAMKLSRMIGTSVKYWLNLQNAYDALMVEFNSQKELEEEKKIFKHLDYKYFRENFKLPDYPRKQDKQIKALREFLNVSSLTVFKNRDMAVSFRSTKDDLNESSIVKANIMVQLATNKALNNKAAKYNKKKFEKAVDYALTLTKEHEKFYLLIKNAFFDAGVIFIVLPNILGSKINGATKKIGDNVMLMVNDRRLNSDAFWFTLFHEIGHVLNGDFGISFEKETGDKEAAADLYAENRLIPPDKYKEFIAKRSFTQNSIINFANEINRDPGIVVGRLQNDKLIEYNDYSVSNLRHKYKVKIKN